MTQFTSGNGGSAFLMPALLLLAGLIGLSFGASSAAGFELVDDVEVRQTAVGPVLADGRGFSLYTFEADKDGRPTCLDACAEAWPPLVADAGDESKGDFGIVQRSDGLAQWTYKNKPLYRWTRDTVAGSVGGDGIDDLWSVARP